MREEYDFSNLVNTTYSKHVKLNMGYWNHRVIYKKDNKTGFESFEIHEVYYSKKGKIKSWTEEAVSPFGETKNILKKELKYFKDALKKPVLTEKKKGKKIKLVELD